MIASTLFIRVVPADKNRGFVLLAGYDASVVQRTALGYTTLGEPTRASLNASIERMRISHSAKDVKDVTAVAIQKKLAKLFGETSTPVAPETFSSLGVGSYL